MMYTESAKPPHNEAGFRLACTGFLAAGRLSGTDSAASCVALTVVAMTLRPPFSFRASLSYHLLQVRLHHEISPLSQVLAGDAIEKGRFEDLR